MSMSESVTEFSEVLPTFLPHLFICKSWEGGLVVGVGSCGGTDSGT